MIFRTDKTLPSPGGPVLFPISIMTLTDLPGVWAIEQTLTGPWTQSQLNDELTLAYGWHFVVRFSVATDTEELIQHPSARQNISRPEHSGSSTQSIIGYIFGTTILDQAEIRKIAVAPKFRQQGIASHLLATVDQFLITSSVKECFLELRATNSAALTLYQKNGFQRTGQRKNYYTLPADDAILMKKIYNDQGQLAGQTAGNSP